MRGLNQRAQPGFTLIEMLVVLAIIVIISAIALSGQNTFSRTEALNNAAYDIGLSIRQAQSYGLANSLNNGNTAAFYNVPFGISVRADDLTHYVLFSDTFTSASTKCGANYKPDCVSGNGVYDPNVTPPEAVQTYALNNGFSFGAYCVSKGAFGGGNTATCSTDSSNPISRISVTFARPNGQANIAAYTKNGGWTFGYTYACLQVSSGAGDYRYVSISANNEVVAGIKSNADPSGIVCP